MRKTSYAILIRAEQTTEELSFLLVEVANHDQSMEKAILLAAQMIILNNCCEKTARILKAYTQLPPSR